MTTKKEKAKKTIMQMIRKKRIKTPEIIRKIYCTGLVTED
jgi:hypothetical protein